MKTQTLNFNAAFATTPEITLAFAKFKGYQEEINSRSEVEHSSTVDGETTTWTTQEWVMIPNPQTPEEFVCNYMKNYIANELNGMTVSQAWADANKAAQATTEAGLQAIKDVLKVDLV